MLRVERALADRLVVERCWGALEVLDESHPLRRDAGAVNAGLGAMDAGDWAQAASLLRGVPRQSPFAAWRLFCKAMVCFDAGDDAGLRRILDLLPEDFALARTVAECRRVIAGDGGGDGAGGTSSVLAGDRAKMAVLAGELKQALNKRKVRAVGAAIEKLADALYPEDPDRARLDLLEVATLAAARDLFPVPALRGLVQRLLPAERLTGVMARLLLLGQQVAPHLWNPAPAPVLFDLLAAEFPRAGDRALARACVLETLARTGRAAIHPDFLSPQMEAGLTLLLGRPLEDPGMVFAELMMASLEADPDNRDGYLFLLDLLRGQATDKRRLQRVLQDMADRFPDDATPLAGAGHPTLFAERVPPGRERAGGGARAGPPRRSAAGSAGCGLPQVGRSEPEAGAVRTGRPGPAAGRGTRAQGDRAGPARETAAAGDGVRRRGRGRDGRCLSGGSAAGRAALDARPAGA